MNFSCLWAFDLNVILYYIALPLLFSELLKFSPDQVFIKSALEQTSALTKYFWKSVWISPAASLATIYSAEYGMTEWPFFFQYFKIFFIDFSFIKIFSNSISLKLTKDIIGFAVRNECLFNFSISWFGHLTFFKLFFSSGFHLPFIKLRNSKPNLYLCCFLYFSLPLQTFLQILQILAVSFSIIIFKSLYGSITPSIWTIFS